MAEKYKSIVPQTAAERVMAMAETDTQLQALMPIAAVETALKAPGLAYWQVADIALSGYSARPALGERAYDVVAGRRVVQETFNTITYGELRERVIGIAAAWQAHPQHRVGMDEFVCSFGFSGIDYAAIDLACVFTQAISVPLQANLQMSNLDNIFTDTAPVAVASTIEELPLAAKLAAKHGSVRSVIAFDYDPRVDAERERYEAAQAELAAVGDRVQLITLNALMEFGRAQSWQPPAPPTGDTSKRMFMVMHSSGSTGTPKGAMITEASGRSFWNPSPSLPSVRVAFAPMNHLGGRSLLCSTLARGGTAFFTAKPDLSELFTDIRLVRPTEIVFFPRVLEMIHQHYLGEVVRAMADGSNREDASAAVMATMRSSFLGDRVVAFSVGAAPTTPEIRQFMNDCFQVRLVDGYGSTEAGVRALVMDRIQRPPVSDYRLRDVPELGYFTTDKPYPRGEFCVKTEYATTGYFKKPELTAALFDADGFLCTGDIMEERAPDNLVYIDRRNDVLKLSQAEFVAVGALGNKFENGSDVIRQIYVYGNSARAYLLAVVVPDMTVVRSRLGDNPDDAALRALIRDEMKRVAAEQSLRSFEIPRDFIVEREAFSRENGLLTSVHKRMRPAIKAKYGERLEQMYVDLEKKQNDELMALQAGGGEWSVLQKIGKALEATLGIDDIELDAPYTFTDLGGDSLSAASFSVLLKNIFKVTLPVGVILSPAGSLQQWAKAIEAALSHQAGLATFEQVHGAGATRLRADDLALETFLGADVLNAVPTESPRADIRTVLVTGATGFLGRFLCLEWLQRMAAVGGTVICLVRATDQAAARQRLVMAFGELDAELAQRFRTLADKHLDVLVGDVAEMRLGLDPAAFTQLAERVDHIVHPAALVNHVLPYEALFEPNVAGTAEVIRLALTSRKKRIDYISTVATTRFLEYAKGADENTPLAGAVDINENYGNGYGTSKWAAEQLLHRAHEQYGLPSNIFRGDMMLAHRVYRGQINVPDVFSRLLYSVIVSGLAPKSFYRLNADGSRAQAHYDGLPVDFIAAAMAGIGASARQGIRTYHVFNHHVDDGVSLDRMVDWIEAAGYRIERVDDYATWLRRFEATLDALPREKRQLSSLNVIASLRQPWAADEAMLDSSNFVNGVREIDAGPEVPHLDHAFIDKCLRDLQALDLIAAPRA